MSEFNEIEYNESSPLETVAEKMDLLITTGKADTKDIPKIQVTQNNIKVKLKNFRDRYREHVMEAKTRSQPGDIFSSDKTSKGIKIGTDELTIKVYDTYHTVDPKSETSNLPNKTYPNQLEPFTHLSLIRILGGTAKIDSKTGLPYPIGSDGNMDTGKIIEEKLNNKTRTTRRFDLGVKGVSYVLLVDTFDRKSVGFSQYGGDEGVTGFLQFTREAILPSITTSNIRRK